MKFLLINKYLNENHLMILNRRYNNVHKKNTHINNKIMWYLCEKVHTHLCPNEMRTPNWTNEKQHRAMHFAIALFFRNQSTLDRNSVFRTKTSFILPFIQPHKVYMIEHRTPLLSFFFFLFMIGKCYRMDFLNEWIERK